MIKVLAAWLIASFVTAFVAGSFIRAGMAAGPYSSMLRELCSIVADSWAKVPRWVQAGICLMIGAVGGLVIVVGLIMAAAWLGNAI